MQATGRQPQRAPVGAPVDYERHRPEQTTLCRLVQQHAATFFAETEVATGADLAQFVKDEFDVFLECGILAHGFLRLRCGDRGHDRLVRSSPFARVPRYLHRLHAACACCHRRDATARSRPAWLAGRQHRDQALPDDELIRRPVATSARSCTRALRPPQRSRSPPVRRRSHPSS